MIRRMLVANRGEAARRIFASCRLIGIETVAIHSDADAHSPHVAAADWAVHLPGNAPTATYLRGDLIIAAAHKTGADAIHPGWGFLATNPDFAAAVTDTGLTWVGPPAKTVALLTDRRGAALRLAAAGLPVLPGWGDPAEVDQFPVLVTSARGSGGRSWLARDPDELAEAVAAARREAVTAYGDGSVYCERYVERARHLHIPIMLDTHGNVVVFGECEGSIQRSHQPLLVETPSPVIPPEVRERLVTTAVQAATALEFVGAGTARFLLAPDGTYHLRELDPCLPPEHGVIECVAGTDMVRLQVLIAEGQPLPLRSSPPMRGHAIGVRLRAEDPGYAWMPTTGSLHRFLLPQVSGEFKPLPVPGLRADAAVSGPAVIGTHYDSALATLVAWSPARYEAARLLAASLAQSQIHGVTTNRDLLVRVLRHPTFLAGAVDTTFLDDHPEVFAPLLSSVDAVRLSCLAAALAAAAARRARAPVFPTLPSGWRNVPSGAQTKVYQGPAGMVEIGYHLDRNGELGHWWVRGVDPDELDLTGLGQPNSLPDDHPPVAIVSRDESSVVLDVTGIRLVFAVHRIDDVSYVDSTEGSVVLAEVPRYPELDPIDDLPD